MNKKNKVKFISVSEAAMLAILHGIPLLFQVNEGESAIKFSS